MNHSGTLHKSHDVKIRINCKQLIALLFPTINVHLLIWSAIKLTLTLIIFHLSLTKMDWLHNQHECYTLTSLWVTPDSSSSASLSPHHLLRLYIDENVFSCALRWWTSKKFPQLISLKCHLHRTVWKVGMYLTRKFTWSFFCSVWTSNRLFP